MKCRRLVESATSKGPRTKEASSSPNPASRDNERSNTRLPARRRPSLLTLTTNCHLGSDLIKSPHRLEADSDGGGRGGGGQIRESQPSRKEGGPIEGCHCRKLFCLPRSRRRRRRRATRLTRLIRCSCLRRRRGRGRPHLRSGNRLIPIEQHEQGHRTH